MNAASSQGFKFRIEDDPPEHCLEADEDDIRIARLNRRVTWVALLVPCLAGLLLAAGYLDLKGRLEGIDRAGVEEMQALAKGLDARVSALAGQQAALEKSLGERLDQASLNGDALAGALKAAEARLSQSLDRRGGDVEKIVRELTASKVDRQELEKLAGQAQKAMEPLEQRLAAVSAEVTSLDNNLSRELAALTGTVERIDRGLSELKATASRTPGGDGGGPLAAAVDDLKRELSRLKSQVAGLSGGGVDPDYIDARLLKEQRIYQLKLEETARDIRSALSDLQKQVAALRASPSSSRF